MADDGPTDDDNGPATPSTGAAGPVVGPPHLATVERKGAGNGEAVLAPSTVPRGVRPATPPAPPVAAAPPQPPAAAALRRIRTAAALVFWSGLLVTLSATLYAFATIRQIDSELPPVPHLARIAVSTLVTDRNGLLLRPFTIGDGTWRLPASEADVDPLYLRMLFAYEDRTFRTNDGIDWSALMRAAGQFVGAGGHIVSGGSTLTMQVARLIDAQDTRSIGGKLRQILFARKIDRALTKAEILNLYLTLAPFGGNLEGVRAASLAYFGKEPGRLTPAEAALLVALPQSPEARRPDRDPAAARAGRDRVLARMVETGILTEEEAAVAMTEAVPTARQPFPMIAFHLAEAAVAAAPELPVHQLTIDRQAQTALEALAADRAAALGPLVSVAIVVADWRTGQVLASVGSAGFLDETRGGFIDMTNAVRSPGSALKPLIYGLAFEDGLAMPASLIEDRPTSFGDYTPVNFDGFYRGTVTMTEALQQSLNVPAVIILDAVGPAQLVARLRRAGANPVLPALTAPGLAVGLGGVGVTLNDLVQTYAAIARGGTPVALRDGVDDPPLLFGGTAPPVLDPVAAWYVADILAGVPPPANGSPGRIAYKTGTSYGYRDAWAIGFDGVHVIGVWVGRPDGTPIPGLSGAGAAAPILFESFDRLGTRSEPLPPPPPGVQILTTAELPEPLRRFRHQDEDVVARDPAPEFAYPADGVRVDLGIATANPTPLAIKVRNGAPPFTWLVNGLPIAQGTFGRDQSWDPTGPGFVTITVIDGDGRSARVTVFVE